MKFRTIRALPDRGSAIVILEDQSGQRFLPIYVDESQALSIYLGQRRQKASRPLTHDLLASVFEALDARLEKVVITELKDGVYYADMVLNQNDHQVTLDSRPSDAIALALRLQAPIYANTALLERYSESGETPPAPMIPQMTLQEWGITVQELDAKLKKFFGGKEGLLLSDVQADSPAGRAGLEAGDLLLRVGDRSVRGLQDFQKAVGEVKGLPEVYVTILRDGSELQRTLEFHR